MTRRVVFDTVVYVQAVANRNGPSAVCLARAFAGAFALYASTATLNELRDVFFRPKLRRSLLRITDEEAEGFLTRLATLVTVVESVPAVFVHPRDPKDEKFVDLALAAGAKLLVSRDNDLLDLMADQAFRTVYPDLTILDPVAFLQALPPEPTAPAETN